VQRNWVLVKAACRSAVEETTVADRRVECFLDDHCVEHRLQRRTATHDGLLDSIGLAPGFVIGDPQHFRLSMALDQIDAGAQPDSILEHDIVSKARRIANAGHTSKRKFEAYWLPVRAVAREVAEPGHQVATDGGDFIHPDSLDCGSELVMFARCNLFERVIE